MRILITGATGFLGSAVVRACITLGFEVRVLRRNTSNLARLEGVIDDIDFYDTSDAGINDALQSCGVSDCVLHAATCYGRQGESMSTLLESNAALPLRILERAAALGMSFLNIDTVLDPRLNAYSLSKHQFSDWGRLFAKFGQFRFVNVRLEHLYGPGDDASRFVPRVISQCLSNTQYLPFTEGNQLRDFIYINDAVSGIVKVITATSKLPIGWSEFDLGSGSPISIRSIVESIHQLTLSQSKLDFGAIPYKDNETMESNSDISKLSELGWVCCVPLNEGLSQTIIFEREKMVAGRHL